MSRSLTRIPVAPPATVDVGRAATVVGMVQQVNPTIRPTPVQTFHVSGGVPVTRAPAPLQVKPIAMRQQAPMSRAPALLMPKAVLPSVPSILPAMGPQKLAVREQAVPVAPPALAVAARMARQQLLSKPLIVKKQAESNMVKPMTITGCQPCAVPAGAAMQRKGGIFEGSNQIESMHPNAYYGGHVQHVQCPQGMTAPFAATTAKYVTTPAAVSGLGGYVGAVKVGGPQGNVFAAGTTPYHAGTTRGGVFESAAVPGTVVLEQAKVIGMRGPMVGASPVPVRAMVRGRVPFGCVGPDGMGC